MIMFHAFIACFCSKKNKFLFGFSGSIDLFPHPQRRFGDWLPTKNTGLSNLHGGRCKRHIPPKTEIGRTLREMESVSSQRNLSLDDFENSPNPFCKLLAIVLNSGLGKKKGQLHSRKKRRKKKGSLMNARKNVAR
jgi:hypothetical protein